MRIVVYDCETCKPVLNPKENRVEGVGYAANWGDYGGMGISCICAYVWDEGYRVFMEDNFGEFRTLAEASETLLVGYNNHRFDDRLVGAVLGVRIEDRRSYDLYGAFKECLDASDVKIGGSLNTLCRANFIPGKTGEGAMAPILYQQGKFGQLIDYCLGDVLRTKLLLELVLAGRLRDPASGRILAVRAPIP